MAKNTDNDNPSVFNFSEPQIVFLKMRKKHEESYNEKENKIIIQERLI